MCRHGYMEATLGEISDLRPTARSSAALAFWGSSSARETLMSIDTIPGWIHRSLNPQGGVEGEWEEAKGPQQVLHQQRPPPQPSLPIRMPRRTRGLDSVSSTSCSSGSGGCSASSRSLPGTPASLSSESLRCLNAPRDVEPDESKQALRASTMAELGGNYNCCLSREGRRWHRGYHCSSGVWESIREDGPQPAFDLDVEVLQLRSVLRLHAVEPTDALVCDLLRWRANDGRSA